MKISQLSQPQIGDKVEFETNSNAIVEGTIVGETEDGYVYSFNDGDVEKLEENDHEEYKDSYEEEEELYSGCYVRDNQEGPGGEVFIMRGNPEDRRVRIEDKGGRGWNIAPYRLTKVGDDDPAIARYFGGIDEGEVVEAATVPWQEVISALGQGYPDADPTDSLAPIMQKYGVDFEKLDDLARSNGFTDIYSVIDDFGDEHEDSFQEALLGEPPYRTKKEDDRIARRYREKYFPSKAKKDDGRKQQFKATGYGGMPPTDDDEKKVEALDPSGLQAAASLVSDYILTVKTAEGDTKKYRVRGMQSERLAVERFMKHHAGADVLAVEKEGVNEANLEEIDRRGFLKGAGAAAAVGAAGYGAVKLGQRLEQEEEKFLSYVKDPDDKLKYLELKKDYTTALALAGGGKDSTWNTISIGRAARLNEFKRQLAKKYNFELDWAHNVKEAAVDEANDSTSGKKYEMMLRNGQVKKFIAKDDADAKRIAKGHDAKSLIKLTNSGVPAGKIAEQGVNEVKHFRTSYGWAGGRNEKTGGKHKHPEAHDQNLDAAAREIDARSEEGEDMTGAKINPKTYAITKPKKVEEAAMRAESVVKDLKDYTKGWK